MRPTDSGDHCIKEDTKLFQKLEDYVLKYIYEICNNVRLFTHAGSADEEVHVDVIQSKNRKAASGPKGKQHLF